MKFKVTILFISTLFSNESILAINDKVSLISLFKLESTKYFMSKDKLGRVVISLINQKQEAGCKSIKWHRIDFFRINIGDGMDFYVLEADDFREIKKIVLLKLLYAF